MKFYNIGRTNDVEAIGNYPQTELADIYNVEAMDSYRRVPVESFPDFEPKYALTLSPNSKATDVLDGVSLNFGIVVSDNLKTLLEKFNLPPFRFYSIDVIGSNKKYFWFHYITQF